MIDGVFSAAVQDALALELPGVYIGEPQDDQAIPGKSVLMELQSDIVVGSPLQRGTLTLNVISQADDYSKAEQAAFAAEVTLQCVLWCSILTRCSFTGWSHSPPTISARNAIGAPPCPTSWATALNLKTLCLYHLEQ